MTNPNKLADALRSTLREYRAEAAKHSGLAGTICNLIGDHLEGLLAEHDAQPAPAPVQPCTMGVGCEEAGVCYASANGQPEQCGARPPTPAADDLEQAELWVANHCHEPAMEKTLFSAIAALRQPVADAFKSYVHERLDAMGVPPTVPSPHTDAGCRVGGRLDWIEQRIARQPVPDAVRELPGKWEARAAYSWGRIIDPHGVKGETLREVIAELRTALASQQESRNAD